MEEKTEGYSGIFKSTFLFGFVQIVRLLVSVIRNKVIALVLGPTGMGMISVFNSSINFIKTGAGLGIAQSAVKDISEANSCDDKVRLSRTISLTNRICVITSLLGLIVTIVFSPILSKSGFGNYTYILSFILLGFAIAFDIFTDNQLAILKGMRRLRSLAMASIIGSIMSLVTGVPLFIIFKEQGIIPSIIISAFSALIVTALFVRKIPYDRIDLSFKELWHEGNPMIKMGVSLMMINFVSYIFDFIIIAFVRNGGGITDVGIYGVGSALIFSYFSIVTTALATDYYPRLAAVSKDNVRVEEEVNKQARVGLTFIIPLAALFVLFTPLIIRILFTEEFALANHFTDIAIFGVVLAIVSDCLGYILIAKQEAKIFLTVTFSFRIVLLPIYLLLYHFLGLLGLGMAHVINCTGQIVVYSIIGRRKYNVRVSADIFKSLLLAFIMIVAILATRHLPNPVLSYTIGGIMALLVVVYSLIYMKNKLDIDLIKIIKNIYGRK